jgi:uncharacterized protein YchJ
MYLGAEARKGLLMRTRVKAFIHAAVDYCAIENSPKSAAPLNVRSRTLKIRRVR